jgi:hypothetical protein
MLLFAALVDIQINESRVDNYAFPRVLAFKLVNLDANIGVASHYIQLLAGQSKGI